jgi:Uma2 family endonuclease
MELTVTRHRFTVNQYRRMAEAGILTEDDRVELLDGEIVEMTPVGRRHAACVSALLRIFFSGVGDRGEVWAQSSIALSLFSEPEPDVAVLRAHAVSYRDADPEPDDVLLVIEVAETSLGRDREVKVPLYARAGVPEVWIADVERRVLWVYEDLRAGSYTSTREVGSHGVVSPAAFPDLRVAVDEIFR